MSFNLIWTSQFKSAFLFLCADLSSFQMYSFPKIFINSEHPRRTPVSILLCYRRVSPESNQHTGQQQRLLVSERLVLPMLLLLYQKNHVSKQ